MKFGIKNEGFIPGMPRFCISNLRNGKWQVVDKQIGSLHVGTFPTREEAEKEVEGYTFRTLVVQYL